MQILRKRLPPPERFHAASAPASNANEDTAAARIAPEDYVSSDEILKVMPFPL